jgi:hypothetical protein
MKAVLEFNLPKDKDDFELATKGGKWYGVVWDMDQWLRGHIKYAPDEMSEEAYKAFEECREKLREIIDDNGVNLDDIS